MCVCEVHISFQSEGDMYKSWTWEFKYGRLCTCTVQFSEIKVSNVGDVNKHKLVHVYDVKNKEEFFPKHVYAMYKFFEICGICKNHAKIEIPKW